MPAAAAASAAAALFFKDRQTQFSSLSPFQQVLHCMHPPNTAGDIGWVLAKQNLSPFLSLSPPPFFFRHRRDFFPSSTTFFCCCFMFNCSHTTVLRSGRGFWVDLKKSLLGDAAGVKLTCSHPYQFSYFFSLSLCSIFLNRGRTQPTTRSSQTSS